MLSEDEVRRWRDLERERLVCLVDEDALLACRNVILLLDAVLGDD